MTCTSLMIAGGKERADRPIDEAGGQDFLGGGPAFALDEAAGELAGGVGLFAVIDDEREEIAAFVGLAFDGGHERHGVAVADHDGAMRLLGQLAGFDDEILSDRRDVPLDMPARFIPHGIPAGVRHEREVEKERVIADHVADSFDYRPPSSRLLAQAQAGR